MKNQDRKLRTPKGTKDLFDDDLFACERLESLIFKTARSFGFQRIETPVFEHVEVFDSTSQLNSEKCYIFEDKAERKLVLRPDINAPISRALINNLSHLPTPSKFFFCGNVYRYRHYLSREFKMFGLESYGVADLKAEIEILLLTKDILKELGVKNYTVEFSNLNIYTDALNNLIEKHKLSINQEEILHKLSLSGSKQETAIILSFLPQEEINFFCKIRHEKIKILELCAMALLPSFDFLSKEQIQLLIEFDNLLELQGITNRRFDSSNLHGTGFYSGLTYRIYSDVINKNIADGGRYDCFAKKLSGIDIPATGLGFSFSRLLNLALSEPLLKVKKPNGFLFCTDDIFSPDANKIINFFRSNELIIELETVKRKFSQRIKYVNNKNYSGLIYLSKRNQVNNSPFYLELFNRNGESVLFEDSESLTRITEYLINL